MPQKKRSRSTQPAPNYTLRRVVVFGGLILVLAGLVWGVVSLVKTLTSANTAASSIPMSAASTQSGVEDAQSGATLQNNQTTLGEDVEKTPDGIVLPDGRVSVPECTLAELKVSTDNVSTTVGNGVDIPYTVINVGNTACHIAAGRFTFTVLSGNDTYLDTGMCTERDPDETPLLLAAKSQWSSSFNWNGGIYNDCSVVDANSDGKIDNAEPGTYIVNVSINGGASGAQSVVTVH